MAVAATGHPLRAQEIETEKYQLPNGMIVILHEDHSVPVACVNTWYYVASKDEAPGRSGFAHLFEHLMFMGTERVPGGEFDQIMEAGGGWNNATTSKDRTNYFSTGPAELLPTLLWLDADRLEELDQAMTQEKLDKQRDVVRNERRQTSENRPYGRAELRIQEMMYPVGHPYQHTVIGSHEDLEAATVDDVKNFFGTYYVPSNASLVVAGDFDPNTIKPIINSLFGTLPRGSDVVHAEAKSVTLTEVKRLTMTDNVQFPRVYMAFHSPAKYETGDAEMELAAAILADGISSRLYQELVYTNKLAVDVSAYQYGQLLGSLFITEVTGRGDVSLDTLEQGMDRALAKFASEGPSREELERQKAKVEYAAMSRLQSVLAKADQMNEYQFFFGEPNSFKRDLDRYQNATVKSVRQWAAKVLTPDARLVLRVIPELKIDGANPRDARPTIGTAPPFAPLLPESFSLSNGITVHHWQRSELPLVAVTAMFPRGTTSDPAEKAGLTELTAEMLDEGAGELGAIEFADALDALGATFRSDAGYETTMVDLSVLARNIGPALDLFADAIERPRFVEKEWRRVHDLHVQELHRSLDEPTYVAATVGMRTYYGADHPYGRPSGGTMESASLVTLDDVKSFHQRAYRPSLAILFVAGDLTANEAKQQLERAFGGWHEPTGVTALPEPGFPTLPRQALRVVFVDRPDAVQSVIQFIMPGPKYGDPLRPKLNLLNTILGGSFTSRLNQNLREEHGYTYGAGSSYQMNPSVGHFTASSSVRADVTGASLKEFLKEFAKIRGGDVTSEESSKARSSQRMRLMQSFSGVQGILDAGVRLVRNGQPFAALGKELAAMARVTDSDLNRIVHDAIPLETGLLVIVGDQKTVLEQWHGLGLPEPIKMTATGMPN
jgi:zinc protease